MLCGRWFCKAVSIGCVILSGSVLCSVCYAEVLELEGTVKAVDASARSITIERKTPKGTKTLELEVAKKAGGLTAIKVGADVVFGYEPSLEVITWINIDGEPAADPHAVTCEPEALLNEVDRLVGELSVGTAADQLRRGISSCYAKQKDYRRAEKEISLIHDPKAKAIPMMTLARVMAMKKDFTEAWDKAASITEDTWRSEALIAVIQEEGRQGVKEEHEAKIRDLLGQITDPHRSASARVRLAADLKETRLQKQLLEEAVQFARTLSDERTRDGVLQSVLEIHLRQDDFDSARKIAPIISEGRRKWGYANTARMHYRDKRVTEGDKVLQEASGVDWQSELRIERAIAKADGKGFDSLEKEVERIKDSWRRFESLVALGEAYASGGSEAGASRCLKGATRLLSGYSGNQLSAGESKAVDLACQIISKGLSDQGLGIQIARDAATMNERHFLQLCNAYCEAGKYEEARDLTFNGLDKLKSTGLFVVGKENTKRSACKEVPKWIAAVESPSDRAWAYLGCCDAIIDSRN
jgi:hypothetical protein